MPRRSTRQPPDSRNDPATVRFVNGRPPQIRRGNTRNAKLLPLSVVTTSNPSTTSAPTGCHETGIGGRAYAQTIGGAYRRSATGEFGTRLLRACAPGLRGRPKRQTWLCRAV